VATDRTSRRPAPAPGPVALFIDWDNFAIGLRLIQRQQQEPVLMNGINPQAEAQKIKKRYYR
jgi:hypothetical protein